MSGRLLYNPAMNPNKPSPRGRGTASRIDNRYAEHQREAVDDGWDSLDQPSDAPRTRLEIDSAKSIIAYNQSPDLPFDRSINPYRGCEHGCSYCYARPSHAWLGLSPGLDFETRLFHKPDAAALLRKELAKKNYQPKPIALGVNTDAYQPVERKLGLTRQILEVLLEHRHPLTIITKAALIERDLDLLTELAAANLVTVALSIPTLNAELARKLEPRATAPARRLQTLASLSAAGIPTAVMVAPLIPVLTDHELENIIEQSHALGARELYYILLRLPLEVSPIFQDWLQEHEPLKAAHVMNRIRDSRGGKDNSSQFGQRMTGEGVFADLIRQRYRRAMKRWEFPGLPELDCGRFTVPQPTQPQMTLF